MRNVENLIVTLASLLPVYVLVYVTWRNARAALAESQRIHQTVNSRMDELLKSEKSRSRAEGHLEGDARSSKPTACRQRQQRA